jgi:hypothetical protein
MAILLGICVMGGTPRQGDQHRCLNRIAVLDGTLYIGARAGVRGGQNGIIVHIPTLICMIGHCVESRGVLVDQQEWAGPLCIVGKTWV